MVFGSTHSSQELSAHARAASVFTPAAPISTISLFRGRSAQIKMLMETAGQTGQHAIVYGERGVGKTSLVSVLYDIVSQAVLTRFHFVHVNCDVTDTFASLWRKIFRELQIDDHGQVTTLRQTAVDSPHSLADRLNDAISPDDIRRLSTLIDGQLVVVIDEFDQLSGNLETIRLIANTIKTLSDRRSEVTLILVGVADTVSQLVAEHESVERNLVQIQMPRMSEDEIGQILAEGLASLGFSIDRENLLYICSLAQGLPASAHRIGLQVANHMIETNSYQVTREIIDASLNNVIDRMPQSHLMDWERATETTGSDNLFEQVLVAAAMAPRDDQGWFSAADILEPLQLVTDNRQCKVASTSQHLHRLATQRGMVLDRARSDGRWQFRFRNPSFQSYVLIKGLSSGVLKARFLSEFGESLPNSSSIHPTSFIEHGQTGT